MKPLAMFFAIATILSAQDLADIVKQGESTFAKTCGTGYCHGSGGAGGGAPRLASRDFDQDYISNTVTNGVKDTPMAAYGKTLSAAELNAVVAYVATLNGIVNPRTSSPAPSPVRAPALSAEAARGKALFSEAARGFARCSTCHEVNGIGIAVARSARSTPATAAELKSISTPNVATATADGESMPAMVIARRTRDVLLYDLSSLPPVLRTYSPSDVRVADGSAWRHLDALGKYTDSELNAVLAYMRATQ